MKPHYSDDAVTLYHGDCLDVLRELPDASVDAVVTDPPYGLGFMGREWDAFGGAKGITDPEIRARQQEKWGTGFGASARPAAPAPGEMHAFQSWCNEWATECLRVLKPGGHMLAFGGTRTWHRLACAIEDAGFEIRDSIAWLYGSGFPKSLDVSKAIDKAVGAEGTYGEPKSAAHAGWIDRGAMRGDDGHEGYQRPWMKDPQAVDNAARRYAPATADAQTWAGWGTALKPAHEPVVVARRPLSGTVAANVLAHGTGAINVDACRVGTDAGWSYPNGAGGNTFHGQDRRTEPEVSTAGRWPANVILDPAAAAELDRQSGTLTSGLVQPHHADNGKVAGTLGAYGGAPGWESYGDTGGASRFFYVAKAGSSERPRIGGGTNSNMANPRCRDCGKKRLGGEGQRCMCDKPDLDYGDQTTGVAHPTVKPLDLMRWLVRLVTPPGGVVLDPFAGSGTTAEACVIEGFRCITIEREDDYLPLILQRLTKPIEPVMF